jgi:hypothetical protein
MEVKTKRNTDYSQSAINLCNPPEVRTLLDNYVALQSEIDNLDLTLRAMPEYEQLTERQQSLASARKEIEQTVEKYGSYQDVDAGRYGLKQRAVTIRYEVGDFENCYPEFVPAVLTKSINVEALKGLLKGGLLGEEGLRRIGVIQEKETFRFIIK